MKVSISYPPLESCKGTPLLSQNRQFQWFNSPTYIYPIVPAYAATLLKENGYDVSWNDGIAKEQTYNEWLTEIKNVSPDIIVFEAKTPVIKLFWNLINSLKKEFPKITLIIVGDHVTAMPEETLQNSKVDYVLTGGDFDFQLLDLCNVLKENKTPDTNCPGVYFWENQEIKNTGKYHPTKSLDELPLIDRDLTQFELYAYKNGNFKFTPGTYQMAGRDCWWGRCTFCSWTTLYPGANFRTVSPQKHLDEIEILVEKYKMKEIFDDAGCFPRGAWLKEFCEGFLARGLHKKVVMGCNMRVGGLTKEEWDLLGKCNYRFVLIGVESLNDETLKRLNKGIKANQIEDTFKMAKQAGCEPHITTMVGYPWESREDSIKTINKTGELFKNGHVDTLQATIVIPYPGTPMFDEADKNGWLLTKDWEKYDMRSFVWKSNISEEEIKQHVQKLYKLALTPKFIIRKIRSLKSFSDIVYYFKAGLKLFGHLVDFKK